MTIKAQTGMAESQEQQTPVELADAMRLGQVEMSPERLWHRTNRWAVARNENMGETFVHAMLHGGRYEGERLDECPKCGADITCPQSAGSAQD